MQGMVKRLISKLKYINRLIISTSEDSQKILLRQDDTEKAVRDAQTVLDEIRKEIECQKQVQEQIREQIRDVTVKLQQNYNKSMDYVNLEYLYLLNSTDKKILLAGFYGARNLGDELMMQKVYQDLNIDKSRVYVLMCDNPELNVFRYPGMNMLHYPKTRFDYSFLADQFECVIFGGGAIIDDVMYRKKDSFTFDMGKIFAELGSAFIQREKKVYSLGLSTSRELTDEEYIDKVKNIIGRSSYFSVRDKYSAGLLQKITGQDIRQINDIVLTYDRPKIEDARKPDHLIIGIIWICYEDLREQLYYLLREMLIFYTEINLEIRLIPFYDYCNCDYSFYLKTKEDFENDERIILTDMPGTFDEIYRELRNCGLILSMRYHGALIGMMTGRRTCSLLYGEHRHYYNKMLDLYEKFDHKEDLFSSVEELCEHVKTSDISGSQTETPIPPDFDNSEYERVIKEICNGMNN